MNPQIAQVRPPYLTHLNCVVTEYWVPIAGQRWGVHITLESDGLTRRERLEKIRQRRGQK